MQQEMPINITGITDVPRDVHEGDKDNFGISKYEDGLVEFIKRTNTPITIALQGEWGSGKTSLMNSLREKLCSEKENSPFHAVWLNTWEYALMKDEFSTLFDIISNLIVGATSIANLNNSQTEKIKKSLIGFGRSAAKILAKAAADKAISGTSEAVDLIFAEKTNSSIKDVSNELESIISKCIEDHKKRGFIFFIDDLDRIDPPIAVKLLELLKNIFTLKNCVFVLAIDYDVIVKGLEPKFGKLTDVNEREFRSFFDKIIQVPFSMPVNNYVIDDFLKESLLSINYLNEKNAKNFDELVKKLSQVCSFSVGNNPRSLKRLLNSLSLINCINTSTSKDETQSNSEVFLHDDDTLFINFALVSIQIAYPLIYKTLSKYPGFDEWNEKVAIQMNLKPLDQDTIDKLKNSEEFNDEWEKILFRICESDYYLKRKSLNISRILNTLRNTIQSTKSDDQKSEDDDQSTGSIEDTIASLIKLSSVTHLEANDGQPESDEKISGVLKELGDTVIVHLKNIEELEGIKNRITKQGKKIVYNTYIKLARNDRVFQLNLKKIDNDYRLTISSEIILFAVNKSLNKFDSFLAEHEKQEEITNIRNKFNIISKNHADFSSTELFSDVFKRNKKQIVRISFVSNAILVDDILKDFTINSISSLIVDIYNLLNDFDKIKMK
jgi:hypothetical protein